MITATATPRASSAGASLIGLGLLAGTWLFSPIAVVTAVFTAHFILTRLEPQGRRIIRAAKFWLMCAFIGGLMRPLYTWIPGMPPELSSSVSAGLDSHTYWLLEFYRDFVMLSPAVLVDLFFTAGLGVPVGMIAGVVLVRWAEHSAAGAEWHPLVRRRKLVERYEQRWGVITSTYDLDYQKGCIHPPLGVATDGDLPGWYQGPFLVIPPKVKALGLLIAGDSGSGKTVTLERKVTIDAHEGRQVVFADCKGSDPELMDRIEAAYLAAQPNARVIRWPEQPLNAWLGDSQAVTNRLVQMQEYSEPYYQSVGDSAVRLVLQAPDHDGRGPCRSSADFLERLSADYLKRAYEGTLEAEVVASLVRRPDALDGVRMRYANFFAALRGAFDGEASFDDADLVLLRVPTLAIRSDAEAALRMLLVDYGHYATVRKPRTGRDSVLIVDEFSAVTSASSLVTNLAERVRDVGCQIVVSVQSWEGLGANDDERQRLQAALAGGAIIHRTPAPERFLEAAGTVRDVEQSAQVDELGATSMGSVRMGHRMKISPDLVRQADTGEAWLIHQGKFAHFFVIQNQVPA